MEKAIEITSLEFEYEKDSKVFSDLSLSIQKGEYVVRIIAIFAQKCNFKYYRL